ncbi:hypothetical protein RFI_25351 [Reticulomyxa filosa]|uniref:Nephrocystin-3 n=1 Tax=Reticulomyxa filosa TaxID=46433 RepID=X6MG49_RETFI|nr:hypothetical protein RFI_25351 [Reticulomyxa filosa]|eukprot:ETO12025.1 hypothetical protein RFI_25351 [Reticulomyxa filosa]
MFSLVIGSNLLNKSKLDEAIELFRFVLCVRLQTLPDSHVDVAQAYFWLGRTYDCKGQYNKSIEYYQKSLNISLIKFKPNHTNIATLYNHLGSVYDRKAEYDKAIAYCHKLLTIRSATDHPDIAASHNNLGSKKKLEPDCLDVASSYIDLAKVCYHKQEYNQAIQFGEKSLKLREKKLGFNHRDVGYSYNILGYINYRKGDKKNAKLNFENALSIYTRLEIKANLNLKYIVQFVLVFILFLLLDD